MAQPQAYSIAELTRSKLLHETSVKNRDLRRLVGHVNMYDRLLDAMNAAELRERENSRPKSIKTESDNRNTKLSTYHSPNRIDAQELEAAMKEIECFGYSVQCRSGPVGSRGGYGVVEVVEVEILDDDD
jgi:hypothetical protein